MAPSRHDRIRRDRIRRVTGIGGVSHARQNRRPDSPIFAFSKRCVVRGLVENCWWRRALVGGDQGVDRVMLVEWRTGKRDMWTNEDVVMLLVVVETRADRAVWFGHGEYQLENRSPQKVREAQARANEARLERERQNVDDAASFLVELGRLVAVDEWERGRVVAIRAEGERRRHEHRQAGAGAVSRMLDRGETLAAIAELAGVKVSDVRAVLKSSGAHPIAPPDALGAPGGSSAAPDNGGLGAPPAPGLPPRPLGVGESV